MANLPNKKIFESGKRSAPPRNDVHRNKLAQDTKQAAKKQADDLAAQTAKNIKISEDNDKLELQAKKDKVEKKKLRQNIVKLRKEHAEAAAEAQAKLDQERLQLTSATQSPAGPPTTFSKHHEEVLERYTSQLTPNLLMRDDHVSGDIHAGVSYYIPSTDPKKPDAHKKAFSAMPDGVHVYSHAFDDRAALAEAIRLSMQMHQGDIKTMGLQTTPAMKAHMRVLTKELFEADLLVDHNGVKFLSVTFNGETFGAPTAGLNAGNTNPAPAQGTAALSQQVPTPPGRKPREKMLTPVAPAVPGQAVAIVNPPNRNARPSGPAGTRPTV